MEQRIKKNIQEVKIHDAEFYELNDTEADEDTTSNIEDNTNRNASEMHVYVGNARRSNESQMY